MTDVSTISSPSAIRRYDRSAQRCRRNCIRCASPLNLSGNGKLWHPVGPRAPHVGRPPGPITLISRHQTDDSSGNRLSLVDPRQHGSRRRQRRLALVGSSGAPLSRRIGRPLPWRRGRLKSAPGRMQSQIGIVGQLIGHFVLRDLARAGNQRHRSPVQEGRPRPIHAGRGRPLRTP